MAGCIDYTYTTSFYIELEYPWIFGISGDTSQLYPVVVPNVLVLSLQPNWKIREAKWPSQLWIQIPRGVARHMRNGTCFNCSGSLKEENLLLYCAAGRIWCPRSGLCSSPMFNWNESHLSRKLRFTRYRRDKGSCKAVPQGKQSANLGFMETFCKTNWPVFSASQCF